MSEAVKAVKDSGLELLLELKSNKMIDLETYLLLVKGTGHTFESVRDMARAFTNEYKCNADYHYQVVAERIFYHLAGRV